MWLVVVLGLIAFHLLSMVQTIHGSFVVYYWVNSPSGFKSPKALIDSKTQVYIIYFKSWPWRSWLGTQAPIITLFPWWNWLWLTSCQLSVPFLGMERTAEGERTGHAYYSELSPSCHYRRLICFSGPSQFFLWPKHKSSLRSWFHFLKSFPWNKP